MDRLSRCANEALARGMTYGKYMSLYGSAEPIREEPVGDTICKCCGKAFFKKVSKRKLYCSFECYENWSREQSKQRARRDRGWKAAI